MSYLVAVYGSLKQGYGNHELLAESKFLGTTLTQKSEYAMYSMGGFPAVVYGGVGYSIVVELYEVDEDTMERLDWLEGHPSFYKRELTELDDGHTAWMYIYQDSVTGRDEVGDEW